MTDKDTAWHAKVLFTLALFWFSLTVACRETLGNVGHACMALGFLGGHYYFVPSEVAFAYVQTCIILMLSITELVGPKYDHYNAIALICRLPVCIIPWVEAMACESFLVHIGGHFWYDMTIPLGLTAYVFYLKQK